MSHLTPGDEPSLVTSPLIAFLATANAERSKTFYSVVLRLRLRSDEPFVLVFEANGTLLRIQKTDAVTPAPYTALGWHDVELVSETRFLGIDAKVTRAGIVIHGAVSQ